MSKSSDRLTLLATFARIAERGSISAAARDLGLSQASASRRLAELEERLGARLAHRTTHELALTEAGETALADARALLDGWDALAEKFREADGALSGALKVVAPVALGQLHLAEAALTFQARHPAVSISWLLDDAPIRFAEIGCDLWIKIGAPRDDTLAVREIGVVERLLVAAPDFARDVRRPGDLERLPCAALDPFEGGVIPLSGPGDERAVLRANVAFVTNNIFTARQAARTGVGYAVAPRWLVEDDLAAGRLIDLLPRWRAPALTVTASYRPGARRTRRLKAFLTCMEDAIAQVPGVAPAPGAGGQPASRPISSTTTSSG